MGWREGLAPVIKQSCSTDVTAPFWGGGETAGEVGTCCGGYMGWLQVQQKKISVLTRSA